MHQNEWAFLCADTGICICQCWVLIASAVSCYLLQIMQMSTCMECLRLHIAAHEEYSLRAAVAPQEAAASCAHNPQQAACAPLRPVAIHLITLTCAAAYSTGLRNGSQNHLLLLACGISNSKPACADTLCDTHAHRRHISHTHWRCSGPAANGLVQLLREAMKVTSPACQQLMQGHPRCTPRKARQGAGAEQSCRTQRCSRLGRLAVAVPQPALSWLN